MAAAEARVEKYLKGCVKYLGGVSLKFVSPGKSGMPDQMAVCFGRVFFFEVKAPGEKPRPRQLAAHALLRQHGASVFVVDSYDSVDEAVLQMRSDRK